MKERDLFVAAIAIADPDERDAFLTAACSDAAQKEHLLALLAAEPGLGTFLEAPARPGESTGVNVGPGSVIGPYKLLEEIGEGGMGVVFMAEQTHTVRRRVALKVIKPGMDSRQVIARFEAERQALAMMEHPNIARVLDAGSTDSGRPYFVMELVRGVPITEYCDLNRLDAEDRLELFVTVCLAIQHAHQKGIIHRDIKPSNVMVTLQDGRPVAKVIDFGIAKAIEQRLTEKTLFTSYGQMIGTPAYMSPEQAEMGEVDVDTRSDIYSLGVLLYELMTGTTPIESTRLHSAGFSEIQRLIREETPTRPSSRLSTLGEAATVLAGNRGTDPGRLARFLAGDLDWIMMKALEKDRTRRYATAGDFAADVERFLRREAVVARPPSSAYRLATFARRHRRRRDGRDGGDAGPARRDRDRDLAGGGGQSGEADRAGEGGGDPGRPRFRPGPHLRRGPAPGPGQRARQGRDPAGHPRGRAAVRGPELRRSAARRGPPARDDGPVLPVPRGGPDGGRPVRSGPCPLHAAPRPLRRQDAEERQFPGRQLSRPGAPRPRRSSWPGGRSRRRRALLGPDDPSTLESMSTLAKVYGDRGQHGEAVGLREPVLAGYRARLGPDRLETIMSMMHLANSYAELDRRREALELDEQALAAAESAFGHDHLDVIPIRNNLALDYAEERRYEDALKLHEETLAICKAKLGADHPMTLVSLHNVAKALADLKRYEEALGRLREAFALQKVKPGPEHPETIHTMYMIGNQLGSLDRYAEALEWHQRALALHKAKLGPDNRRTLYSMWGVGLNLLRLGRESEALPVIDECLGGAAAHPAADFSGLADRRLEHFEKARDAEGCRLNRRALGGDAAQRPREPLPCRPLPGRHGRGPPREGPNAPGEGAGRRRGHAGHGLAPTGRRRRVPGQGRAVEAQGLRCPARWRRLPRADRGAGGEAEVTDVGSPRHRRPIQAEDGREVAGRPGDRDDPRS